MKCRTCARDILFPTVDEAASRQCLACEFDGLDGTREDGIEDDMSEDIPYRPHNDGAADRILRTPDEDDISFKDDDDECDGPAPFQVGDVVRLTSGGPAMTVEAVIQGGDNWQVKCAWFACRHDNQSDVFDARTLEPTERDDERLFGYDCETQF